MRIRSDAVTVYLSAALKHWETGKCAEALKEVRRPACVSRVPDLRATDLTSDRFVFVPPGFCRNTGAWIHLVFRNIRSQFAAGFSFLFLLFTEERGMKKAMILLMVLLFMMSLLPGFGVCSVSAESAAEAEEEEEENYDTGDAALDDTRNQDGIGEKELLVVSFGTSFNDSRRLTIGAIESALAESFPDFSVRRGFTSQIIIDHVLRRDGAVIDNVTEALDRAADNGVKTLVVQPTHLMNGFEYEDLLEELAEYADAFEQIAVGEPLLTSEQDFEAVAAAVVEATAEYDDGKTAIVFMGHGTEADSNAVYARMQGVFEGMGAEHYYIGTVEASPSLDDVLAMVQSGDYERVVLEPLMVVAGDHANNDMAGDDEDSWKSVFEASGYEVVTLLRGLGELEAVRDLYIAHAQAAVDSLS